MTNDSDGENEPINNNRATKSKRDQNQNSPTEDKTKKTKITTLDHWLAVPTQNRFENLQEVHTEESPSTSTTLKLTKPPPIFVHGVLNIKPLISLLENIAKEEYEIKTLNTSVIKIQVKKKETYSEIIKALKLRNTEFHSYQLKDEKTFKVVVRGLHHTSDIKDIEKELNLFGHTVVNISNMKSKQKTPLPMFFVDIKQHANNKNIYEIKNLLHCKINIEPPHKKNTIPQCTKCQRYNHTQKFCNHNPRCVKCGGDHLTVNCLKDRSTQPTCALCKGNHTANYKGCQVYKDLQIKRFPPQREITIEKPVNSCPPSPTDNTGTTYADKVKNTALLNEETPRLSKLEEMMAELMKGMNNMLSLLTILINKISKT